MDEVSKGWLKGILISEEVPDHFPLSRRLGVVQGPKIRCVDDYTRSSVNLALQVTESISQATHNRCPSFVDGRGNDRMPGR